MPKDLLLTGGMLEILDIKDAQLKIFFAHEGQ